VKEYNCQDISQETLVAYADGELPASEAQQIKKHIAHCENCRTMLKALQRSLLVTQTIWKSRQAQWPKKYSYKKPLLSRWLVRRLTAVAASILVLISIGVIRLALYRPTEKTFSIKQEPKLQKIDDIEMEVHRAGLAAQMLAVADMLADQPGGEQYAEKRYTYIINSFAGREESKLAKLRLQNLLERRIKQ
jgi:hypothetical protein